MFNPTQVILQQYLKLIKRRNSKNFRLSLTPRKADYDVNKHIIAKDANGINEQLINATREEAPYFHVGVGQQQTMKSRVKRRIFRA